MLLINNFFSAGSSNNEEISRILQSSTTPGAFSALVKVVISQWYFSQEMGIGKKSLVFKTNTDIKDHQNKKNILTFLISPSPLHTTEVEGIPPRFCFFSFISFVNCFRLSLREVFLFFFRTHSVVNTWLIFHVFRTRTKEEKYLFV